MVDLNTEEYWSKIWSKWRHDDKKNYLKAMFDRANTPDYWDNLWQEKKGRRFEKYSMQRTWWEIEKVQPKTILEAGCGNGRLLYPLKDKYDCFGIDLSPVAINRMKNEFGVNGLVMNVYDIDKLERTFDFIIANHLLEHLEKDKEFLQKCRERLNTNGTFFCAVPNDMSGPEETEEHIRKYNKDSLEALLLMVFGNAKMEIIGNHLIAISKKI